MIDAMLAQTLSTVYPVWAALSDTARSHLQVHARVVHLPAGHVLFAEQQRCAGFPFVLQGEVRVVKSAPSGRELPLYRVRAGQSCVLTSACLLAGQAYTARGVAETDCTVLLVPPATFETLMEAAPFRHFVFQLFAERLTSLMQLVEAVAFQRLDQRLAAELLARNSPLHCTHQHLADELGSVREIVSRLLKGFAAQGLVRLGREHIEILDRAALQRLASGAV